MDRLRSYTKVYKLGHAAIKELFFDEVSVEEKIDGSQFSFSKDDGGQISCRSHHQQIEFCPPDNMFAEAVATVEKLIPILHPNWIYRCEYLNKPQHDTLKYNRTPNNCLIVFDIDVANEDYLPPEERGVEANRLGLETVPIFHQGKINSFKEMEEHLSTTSCLGGTTVEGIVFKNRFRFGRDKKILAGKYVRESFKEKNQANWKQQNHKHIIQQLAESLRTEARWQKSVQHLREQGLLVNQAKDIGLLIKEIPNDVQSECAEEIKEHLYKWAWPEIRRQVTKGMPEWYKEQLAKSQFND